MYSSTARSIFCRLTITHRSQIRCNVVLTQRLVKSLADCGQVVKGFSRSFSSTPSSISSYIQDFKGYTLFAFPRNSRHTMANGHRGIEKLQHVVCFGVECLGDVLIRLTITAGRGDRVGGDPAGLNSSLPARQGSLCVRCVGASLA